jgi:hypothetical protein
VTGLRWAIHASYRCGGTQPSGYTVQVSIHPPAAQPLSSRYDGRWQVGRMTGACSAHQSGIRPVSGSSFGRRVHGLNRSRKERSGLTRAYGRHYRSPLIMRRRAVENFSQKPPSPELGRSVCSHPGAISPPLCRWTAVLGPFCWPVILTAVSRISRRIQEVLTSTGVRETEGEQRPHPIYIQTLREL